MKKLNIFIHIFYTTGEKVLLQGKYESLAGN